MPDKMEIPQPTAVKAPLPCYGTGYSAKDAECAACPHRPGCMEIMERKLRYVPLRLAKFDLVPPDYDLVYEKTFAEDPEIAAMQRTYVACYRTIFGKHPPDSAQSRAPQIADAAKRNDCSIRLYLLACMLGHSIHQGTLKELAGRAKAAPFTVRHLTGKIAEGRAKMFRETCAKEYGTFSVSSLDTLSGLSLDKDSPEYKVLTSEVKVGHFIVDYKIGQGGPVYQALYRELETTLDPLWLAIEESYKVTILDGHLARPRGTDTEKSHRFAVTQAITYLKKHKQAGLMVHITRQDLMPKAIREVLSLFGYGVDDFEIENTPVTDPINLWVTLGLAIQHHQCLKYLDDEHSMLFRS